MIFEVRMTLRQDALSTRALLGRQFLRRNVSRLCSNESLHLEGVEYPPIEAVQLTLEQCTCFLSLPDSRTSS